ncbi:sensor domain-containing diguanylate cyclase [Ancylobacter sp. SL191]|uniref:sensor domain-containing diguanylate cyclase n=1 Tax=Ancylobacter sp. SL191 TaxID=2995166 RepID=UPI00226EB4DB|nr:diguanylate cyclase [Ancylobacter sp. SL191]WAC28390.1 diguanylate cyclase [Ancylobacter sp. SL191]
MDQPQDRAASPAEPAPLSPPATTAAPARRRTRSVSLRLRLAAIALGAMLLVIAERTVSIVQLHADNLAAAEGRVLDMLDRGMARYDQTLTSARAVLATLSADPWLLPIDLRRSTDDDEPPEGSSFGGQKDCALLERVVQVAPMLEAVAIINASGIVRCSSTQGGVGLDLSSRSYYQLASHGLYSVEAVERNYVIGAPSVLAAQPVQAADGTMAGMFLGRVGMSELFPHSVLTDLGVGSQAIVVNPSGRAMLTYPEDAAQIGANLIGMPAVARALSSTRGTLVADGPDGVRRVYAYARLAETNMHLIVGMDQATIMGPVEQATWRAGLAMLAVSMLMLISLWLAGSHLIVRPVQVLAERLIRFGRGEQDETRSDTRIVELQPLVTAFEAMSGELTRREGALRNANRRLNSLASLDPLTGIANRRSFDTVFALQWNAQQPLAILLIDIDSFKSFNDRYGHREGDGCIRAVAQLLAGGVRATDVAARIGGEEFAVLMPGSGLAAASDLAERLRGAVESLAIPHAGLPGGWVTVSVGAAACTPGADLARADLFVAADMALYEAKHGGRNRVRLAEKVEPGLAARAPGSARRGGGLRPGS